MDEPFRLTDDQRRRFWRIVALVCLLGGGLRLGLTQYQGMKMRAWRAACQQIETRAHQQWPLAQARIEALWEHRKSITVERLAQEFNSGQPLRFVQQETWQRAWFLDRQTGVAGEVTWRDGVWDGYGLHLNPGALYPPQPAPGALDAGTEALQLRLAGGNGLQGPLVWGWAALLVACIHPRYRPLLAELLLGWAIVSMTIWLVIPAYSLSPSGVFSNDALFFGVIMLVVSGPLWFGMRPRRIDLTPRCPRCQYNLIGNVSGICSECGQAIPADVRGRIADVPDAG